jgi:hypothetical protein
MGYTPLIPFAPQIPVNVGITACLAKAGLATVLPKNLLHPERGPRRAPVSLDRLKFTIISMTGSDVTTSVDLPAPRLRWFLGPTSQQSSRSATGAGTGNSTSAGVPAPSSSAPVIPLATGIVT